MSARRIISVLAILSFFAISGLAQTIEYDEPVQLTFNVAGTMNIYPFPAWNGSEWAVTYMRFYGEATVHIARCTADGYLIEGHELFGKEKDYGYFVPKISPYEKGWAMVVSRRRYSDQGNDSSDYFVLLNNKARKTGVEANLFAHQRGNSLKPIPVGEMFVVFYRKQTGNGFDGIYMAYINRDGKRVIPDVQVTTPVGESHFPLCVTPTSEGFALLGLTGSNSSVFSSAFYALIALDGTQIVKPKKTDNNGTEIRPRQAVWTGTSFAVAATENLTFDDQDIAPISRLMSVDGTWQGGAIRHLGQAFNVHNGLGFNGERYVAFFSNLNNATIWCQELNDQLRPAGSRMTMDDSGYVDYNSQAAVSGSMTGFFAVMAKVLGGNTGNIYYTRIDFPHSGKPAIKYFNGKIHEFNGKTYVLLDWLATGCESVRMKTKGGRWTLPPYGFHAVEITKKSRYKVVATNDSGRTKAKVKIEP